MLQGQAHQRAPKWNAARCRGLVGAALVVAFIAVMLPSQPAVAATDGLLVFSELKIGIRAIQPDGRGVRTIVAQPGADHPKWSPDGTRIAFDAPPAKGSPIGSLPKVWLVAANGAGRRALGDGTNPSWSADGSVVYFSKVVYDTANRVTVNGNMQAFTLATGATRDLGFQATLPSLSPDHRRFNFEGQTTDAKGMPVGTPGLAIINIDGTGRRTVPYPSPSYYAGPYGWTSDGRVLRSCSGPDKFSDLCALNLATGKETNLTAGHGLQETYGTTSPLGTRIVGTAFDTLFVLDLTGKNYRSVYKSADPNGLGTVDWQPVLAAPKK